MRMTEEDDELAKVKLSNGKIVDEIKFQRPDLVMDVFFTEPETIFTGDKSGLLEAAAELVARRRKSSHQS